MSGLSSKQTLRSSTSSRLPSPSPLTSNAQSTDDQTENHTPTTNHDPFVSAKVSLDNDESSLLEDGATGTNNSVHDSHKELGHKRHRLRHSGGFLLQSASTQGSQAAVARRMNLETNQDVKGKKRAADGDLIIPKRRIFSRHHLDKPIVGSSPLATEVTHDTSTNVINGNGGSSQEEILSVPSSARSSSYHDTSGNGSIRSKQPVDGQESRQTVPSAIGYGTDPAQIVNLALNLSESRRRQFSMGNSPPMALGNRRIPSLAQQNTGSPNGITSGAGGGSLRYYLQSQRHASRNVSPRSSRLQSRDASLSSSPRVEGSNAQHTTSTFDLGITSETIFNPSTATLARAEKARTAFDLFYEYRRLLPNIPAFSTYAKSKPMSSRSSAKSTVNHEDSGRVYNPLQYIRNRKIRYRQGEMLDSEADGWMDVDQVKRWVDAIASDREADSSTLDPNYALPPFRSTQAESSTMDPRVEPSRHIGLPSNRWSFTPWDLLADAHWVHQGDNIKNIEDRDHRKLVPILKHSATPPRTSREIASSPVRRSESSTRQTFTPEKIQSLLKPSRNNSRERGRRRLHLHESKSSAVNKNSSQDRRSRWPRRPIRSRSSSSSYESYDDGLLGHLRDSGYFKGRDPESAALEKQMREMLKKEFENVALPEITDPKGNDNEKMDEVHDNSDKNLSTNSASINADSRPRNWREVDYGRLPSDKFQRSPRVSLDEERGEQIRHSLDEPDYSDLNHVHAQKNIPTIAVDSSSTTNQTTALKKTLPSWLTSHRRNPSKERQAIEERDFETEPKEPKNIVHKATDNAKNQELPSKDRIMAFGNSLLSPTAAEVLSKKFRRPDGASARNAVDSTDPESKLRGFFKGGRIAEIVGNEVHKVGGKLWKKESTNNLSRVSTKSGYASDDSDLEADLSGLDSSPEDRFSRVAANQEESVQLMRKPAMIEGAKNIDRLAGFRSQLPKQNQSSGTLDAVSKDDHITRQQVAQRDRGRSSRFDRLAPPKINIERVPLKPRAQMARTRTQDTDISYSESRQSSGSGSGTPLYVADKRLNAVLGTPGIVGAGGPPVSILSSLESHQPHTNSRPGVENQRQWSISDRGVSAVRGKVTKRDIARIQALLLSSGVKANEIVRRGEEVPESPSALLQTLQQTAKRPLPPVPRSQEHLLAARISIGNIESSNRQLRDDAEIFSTRTMEALYERIRAIDEHVTLKLTPAVRAAADEADDIGTQLTTTHTLAVKELNDSVNVLLRRRGRRFRWVRRTGYVLLEWALLGLMWWVWLIVVIVLLFRGTIRGFVRGVRWLFWL